MKGWNSKGRNKIAAQRVRNFIKELELEMVEKAIPLEIEVHRTEKRIPLEESLSLKRVPFSVDEVWGNAWESAYFKFTFSVSEENTGKPVGFYADFGGEVLFYDGEANPLHFMTTHSVFDPEHRKDYQIIGSYPAAGIYTIYAEAAANDLLGINLDEHNRNLRVEKDKYGSWLGKIRKFNFGVLNQKVWKLHTDMEALYDYWSKIDKTSLQGVRILRALLDATLKYRIEGVESSQASLEPVWAVRAGDTTLTTSVVGHAHIDTAWLWPIAETHRKVTRTFAHQLELMECYSDYVFGASSPQQYKWVKAEHPALYRKVKERVEEGRWETQGAMWVEPDCNMLSGESFVRQILFGKRFWREEFSQDVKVCHIPDVFGYPASMPQIMKKSGVPYFLTQKICWNTYTEFPYDSFKWVGIDGSSVISHFLPGHTYNGTGRPAQLRQSQENFKEKDRLDEFVSLVGMGDGGGGPSAEFIERVNRCRDFNGVPKTHWDTTANFFSRLEAEADRLESYKGDLYLEFHRGTLTSQAWIKKYNRYLEENIRALQAVWTLLPENSYPAEKINRAVEDHLLTHFHDILPGSSIHEVYEESRALLDGVSQCFTSAMESALKKLFGERELVAFRTNLAGQSYSGSAETVSVFNPTNYSGWWTVRLAENPALEGASLDGKYPVRVFTNESGERVYNATVRVNAGGWTSFKITPSVLSQEQKRESLVLENSQVRYRFSDRGLLVEARDKVSGISYLPEGREGNLFSLYEDEPHVYEAWDVDFYYTEQLAGHPEAFSAVCMEGVNGIQFSYRVGEDSLMVQQVVLSDHSPALVFNTCVDWRETRRLLKVGFPIDGRADSAVCDIAYGKYRRDINIKHEYDFARYEFPARNYVDVECDSYSTALITDCKYGWSTLEGMLSLSLLRAPLYPDPDADVGIHTFSYVWYPRREALNDSGVELWARMFNCPPVTVLSRSEGLCEPLPLFFSGEGIAVEAVKPGENSGRLVVRVLETSGRTSFARLHSPGPVVEVNLIEERMEQGERFEDGETVELKPFEIRCFEMKR